MLDGDVTSGDSSAIVKSRQKRSAFSSTASYFVK
jgi:hypothetical protein